MTAVARPGGDLAPDELALDATLAADADAVLTTVATAIADGTVTADTVTAEDARTPSTNEVVFDCFVTAGGPLRVSEVAQACHLHNSTARHHIRRLLATGALVAEPDLDRRPGRSAVQYSLSPTGQAFAAARNDKSVVVPLPGGSTTAMTATVTASAAPAVTGTAVVVADSGRSRIRTSWPRRIVWAALVVASVVLASASWSYAQALSAPGTDSLQARTVEWMRDRGMGTQVNAFENWYYKHHAPPKGGVPKNGALPTLPAAVTSVPQSPAQAAPSAPTPSTPRSSTAPAGLTAVVDFVPPPPVVVLGPPNITPLASPALPDEGVWKATGRSLRGDPVLWTTFMRPDPVHTSLVTGVARMDTSKVKAVMYQGDQEPGKGPWANQAPLPVDQRGQLVAAFNSGFRLEHSKGGYFAEGRTVRDLVDGGASLVIKNDGRTYIGMWGRDYTMAPDVVAVRQNLSLIVDNGAPADGLEHDVLNQWGFTVKNELLVWRSGVGMTADGALLYAAGPGLSVKSLADVLVAAGAVRAMEMDINPDWTNFFVYDAADAAKPQDVTSTKLLPSMQPAADRYFKPSSRDFIAVYLR